MRCCFGLCSVSVQGFLFGTETIRKCIEELSHVLRLCQCCSVWQMYRSQLLTTQSPCTVITLAAPECCSLPLPPLQRAAGPH